MIRTARGSSVGTGRHATAVGGGILFSRFTGLARDAAVAAFLGTQFAADAYWAAMKIPNIIRNLLGEGTLSASFVPVYSEQLESAGHDGGGADVPPARLAASVLGLVLVAAALLSALGVLLAPWITGVVLGTAETATRELTTGLVRILFPMAGVFMVGAWCLGVLTSHDRFVLPFAAPAAWNLAQVGGLVLAVWQGWEQLTYALAWSALVGAVLQVAIQMPVALRLAGVARPKWEPGWEPMRRVLRNTLPVVSSQGIFQLSSLVDLALAGLAGTGALAALGYSQRLVYLPISLFGVSVAASALPAMSRDATVEALRAQLVDGFFRITFFVLPAAVVLLLFGDLAVAVLFQQREFGADSTALVAAILATYSLGLVAMSSIKLFASGFHALQDTRTPMLIAAVSVTTGIAVSAGLTIWMRGLGLGAYAAIGIVFGGVCGSWINLTLHWWLMSRRLGRLFNRHALTAVVRLAAACLVAAGVASWTRSRLVELLPANKAGSFLLLLAVLAAGGAAYLLIARRPPLGLGVSRE